MTSKLVLHASVSGLLLFVSIPSVFAAAAIDSDQCSLNGIVSGGGTIDSEKYTSVELATKTATYPVWGGFGEGALAYTCSAWNFQADAALYYLSASGRDNIPVPAIDATANSRQGHIGGATFWRDPEQGAVGFSGSWVFEKGDQAAVTPTTNDRTRTDMSIWRIGAFGEIYASDALTFGASAHYFTGNIDLGTVNFKTIYTNIHGVEASAFAKFYPTDQLALITQLDFTANRWSLDAKNDYDTTGIAVTLGAEYLVADTNLSLFANGMYAFRSRQYVGQPSLLENTDLQAFIGFKYAFGGNSNATIVGRDRHGTYDNTSIFLEKLPDQFSIGSVGDVASDTL